VRIIPSNCTQDNRKGKLNSLTLAAPVLLGMMLKLAALPPLQSLLEGPSTVFWVATEIKFQIHHQTIIREG
jgi:hypothetical protein